MPSESPSAVPSARRAAKAGGRPRRLPRVRLGLALAPDRVVAVELRSTIRGLRPGRSRSHPLTPADADGGWPALSVALRELRRELRVGGGTVHVALLRPLAHAKVLGLPPVGRRDLGALLARNIRRYFLIGPEPVRTDARRLRGGPARPGVRVLAACAPGALVDAVTRAVEEAGFRVGGITAASVALTEAVRTLVGRVRRGRTEIAVDTPGWSERILLERGAPLRVQAAAAAGHEAAVGAPAGEASGTGSAPEFVADRIVCFGSPDSSAVPARDGVERIPLREPMALAAFGAVLMAGGAPQLLSDLLRARARRRAVVRTARLVTAAVALLVTAGAVQLRGLHRELASVQARRRALARPVAEALAAREAVEGVRVRLEAIARAHAGRRDWAGVFAGLADALPDSAYLVMLSVDGDRLRLDGLARSASRVVPALERSPWFRDVALAAPVRRDGGIARERFTIALVLEDTAGARARDAAARAAALVRAGRSRTPASRGAP